MSEITVLLEQAAAGDDESMRRVFSVLYDELYRIAKRRVDGGSMTLTPTVLLHEAFAKLSAARQLRLESRKHFYACVSRAMKMIVIDHARAARAQKRQATRFTLQVDDDRDRLLDALDLQASLDALEAIDPAASELVSLRFYAGLTVDEAAELMEMSPRSAQRMWQRARAFLQAKMKDGRAR